MPPVAPAPEKDPIITYPACPGCPTPEEAERVQGSCSGPRTVENEAMPVDYPCPLLEVMGITNEEIVYCPKTQKSITR